MQWTSSRARIPTLPIALTTLIGRTREIAEIADLLRQPATRLVTLVGPGGVGKTRLALAVTERVQGEYGDGAVFISLQAIADPSLVLTTIARALGIHEAGGSPLDVLLADALQASEALLVLDNFEHVLAAGPQVSDLLAACPDITVLVTSRAVLRLSGEHDYRVQPLGLPTSSNSAELSGLAGSEAVQLFIERASAVPSDFPVTDDALAAIGTICARLDGLPLAIELAAARTRALSPAALLALLERRLRMLADGPRDAPARQQTMRGTIAWSYELISDACQQLFRALSVFHGGATLDAIESICDLARDPIVGDGAVFENLTTLIDHSLVRHRVQADGSSRFDMLETIREYASEQLAAHGEVESLRERHARYFMQLALDAEPKLHGPRQRELIDLLEAEHPNIRAALSWALEHDLEAGMRTAAGLWYFWLVRSNFTEARAWLDAALARDADVDRIVRARAVDTAASFTSWHGDQQTADVLFKEALRIFREADDRPNIANTLRGMCRMALAAQEHEKADAYCNESVAIYRELGDPYSWGLMAALGNQGWNALNQLDGDRTQRLLDEAISIARHRTAVSQIPDYSNALGYLPLLQADPDGAAPLFTESLRVSWELGDRRNIVIALRGLGWVAAMRGNYRRAFRLFGAFSALRQAIGMHAIEQFLRPELDAIVAESLAVVDPAVLEEAREEGRRMTVDEVVTYALSDEIPGWFTEPRPSAATDLLTPRELDVLHLVVQGKTDREIGAELFISPRTVMNHVSNILAKLNVESRTAAATYAVRHDLV